MLFVPHPVQSRKHGHLSCNICYQPCWEAPYQISCGFSLASPCTHISFIALSKGFRSPVQLKTSFFYTLLFKRLVGLPRIFWRITEAACINSNKDYISFEKILHRQDWSPGPAEGGNLCLCSCELSLWSRSAMPTLHNALAWVSPGFSMTLLWS